MVLVVMLIAEVGVVLVLVIVMVNVFVSALVIGILHGHVVFGHMTPTCVVMVFLHGHYTWYWSR